MSLTKQSDQMPQANCGNQPIVLSAQDQPAFCPRSDQDLWCQHPRVYLTFDERGEASCYYCSQRYRLADANH